MATIPLLHRHQPSVLRGAEHAEDCLLLLDSLSVPCSGLKLLPELYLVPEEEMVAEQARPGSVDRMPAGTSIALLVNAVGHVSLVYT